MEVVSRYVRDCSTVLIIFTILCANVAGNVYDILYDNFF